MADSAKVCVVVGAGTKYASNPAFFGDAASDDLPAPVKWGLGGALPIAFAEHGYHTAILSRRLANLQPIEDQIKSAGGTCLSLECDVTDAASVAAAFAEIEDKLGATDVLCYNAGYDQGKQDAGGNPMGGQLMEDLEADRFDTSYRVHATGLLHSAQQVLPAMRERGSGSVLVSGNTMSLRGGAKFGLNAPSKFAQRAMTQVMAQEYKEFGVHVAHVIIDGGLDAPGMRALITERGNGEVLAREKEDPGSLFLNPGDVAETFVYLAEQPSSVWTHEITLTPKGVTLGQRL